MNIHGPLKEVLIVAEEGGPHLDQLMTSKRGQHWDKHHRGCPQLNIYGGTDESSVNMQNDFLRCIVEKLWQYFFHYVTRSDK